MPHVFRLRQAYVDDLDLLSTATTTRDYRATWGRVLFRFDALRLLIEEEYEHQAGVWESSREHVIIWRERLPAPVSDFPELVAGVSPRPPYVPGDAATRWACMMPPEGWTPPSTDWIIAELQAGRNPYTSGRERLVPPEHCLGCGLPMSKRDRKVKGWLPPEGHVIHSAKGMCPVCYKHSRG